MKSPYFEEIEHTADQALRVRGTDFKELLHNAALGMLELTGAIPQSGPSRDREIYVQAPDREGLLVTWLEELLFSVETRGVTFTKFELHITGDTHLVAKVQETPIAAITKYIKAVTYHDLEIEKTEDGLETTVVFDV
jgi:SHS2 domain-containing protein